MTEPPVQPEPAAPPEPTAPPAAAEAPWGEPIASRFGLIRPINGRYFAGVCAAIGRATNTDPVLWRILLAVLTLFGGIGVAAYLAGWLLVPSEGDTASPAEALLGRGRSSTPPLLVIAIGVIAVPTLIFAVSDGFRPALLGLGIILGAALVLTRRVQAGSPSDPGQRQAAWPFGPAQHPYPGAGPVPTTGEAPTVTLSPAGMPQPGTATDPAATYRPTAAGTTATMPGFPPPPVKPPLAPRGPYASSSPYSGGNPYAGTSPYAASLGYPSPPPRGAPAYPGLGGVAVPPRPRPPRAPRERSMLGRFTISLLCLALGALAMLDVSGTGGIRASTYLAVAVAVIALGLLVGAWAGRARWLIPIGILLSIALAITSTTERWDGPNATGNQTWVPTGVEQLSPSYEARFGNGLLDLRGVDFTDRNITINVTSEFGNFEVILPEKVDAKVTATVKFGSATVFRDNWGGSTRDRTVTDDGTDGEGGGHVTFGVKVNFGNLEVHR